MPACEKCDGKGEFVGYCEQCDTKYIDPPIVSMRVRGRSKGICIPCGHRRVKYKDVKQSCENCSGTGEV